MNVKEEKRRNFKEIEQKLSYPLFVKPNRLGSSIGISKVNNQKSWILQLKLFFNLTRKYLCEAVQNLMEVNCAVIGNDDLVVSLPEQPSYKQEFQTFEEKYLTKGGTIKKGEKKILFRRLCQKKSGEIQKLSKKPIALLVVQESVALISWLILKQ